LCPSTITGIRTLLLSDLPPGNTFLAGWDYVQFYGLGLSPSTGQVIGRKLYHLKAFALLPNCAMI
jgi:hypothetical protein